MSADSPADAADLRLATARARLADATRESRKARIAAAGPLRARARRRTRIVRALVGVTLVVAVVLAGFLVAATLRHHSAAVRSQTDADVLAAADTALTALLTADPKNAEAYERSALAVTTGPLLARLSSNWSVIAEEIGTQDAPSTGQVLASGLVADPPSDDVGAGSQVVLVVEATNPELLGGDPDDRRITVEATMARTDKGWRMSRAGIA